MSNQKRLPGVIAMRESSPNSLVLSLSESLSVLYVATFPKARELPAADAARLLEMGLAKVSDGRFAYTRHGREVAHHIARLGEDAPRWVH